MASLTIFRSTSPREASLPASSAVAVVTSTGTGAGDTPARRERPWWRRLLTLAAPQPPDEIQHAALIRAGSGQGGDSEAGRAIDAVYDALWESRGQAAATPRPGLLMVSSPQVRQARTQALTRWNDAQGRTSGEVLAVLDQAIARVIQDLAAIPAPRLPSLDDHLGAAARTALSAVRASAVHCGEFQRRATCSAAVK